jgi:phage-related protein
MKLGEQIMKLKPIIWVASTKSDLISLPDGVQDEIGHALYQAQKGEKSDKAKPFKGFGNAAVLEIVENNIGGTYRAVYTVKFKEAVAVLHVFQKKSKQGIETSKQDVDLIKSRFKLAEQKYNAWLERRKL